MLNVLVGIFVVLSSLVIFFQLALLFGAAWGEFTLGGKWRGRLPAKARLIPLVSALLIAAFIFIVLKRSGVDVLRFQVDLGSWIWVVVGYCGLGIVANAATPSQRERRIWLPIVSLMFCSSLGVALLTVN
jgi:hypothetical protein